MSDQPTRLTEHAPESAGANDLSVFLVKHHVALVVISGPRKGAEYPLRRERTVIGRGSDADLVFEEETLSRAHAALEFRAGRFVLEDLESANGVLVGGERKAAHELEHGDRFELGRVSMQFVMELREVEPHTHVLTTD